MSRGRELLTDFLAELGLGLAAIVSAVAAALLVDSGWQRHRVVTVLGLVGFLGLAAFGLVLHFRGRPIRSVLSAVAVGAGLLLLSWAYVALMGCC